jgi:hypothetical protein
MLHRKRRYVLHIIFEAWSYKHCLQEIIRRDLSFSTSVSTYSTTHPARTSHPPHPCRGRAARTVITARCGSRGSRCTSREQGIRHCCRRGRQSGQRYCLNENGDRRASIQREVLVANHCGRASQQASQDRYCQWRPGRGGLQESTNLSKPTMNA